MTARARRSDGALALRSGVLGAAAAALAAVLLAVLGRSASAVVLVPLAAAAAAAWPAWSRGPDVRRSGLVVGVLVLAGAAAVLAVDPEGPDDAAPLVAVVGAGFLAGLCLQLSRRPRDRATDALGAVLAGLVVGAAGLGWLVLADPARADGPDLAATGLVAVAVAVAVARLVDGLVTAGSLLVHVRRTAAGLLAGLVLGVGVAALLGRDAGVPVALGVGALAVGVALLADVALAAAGHDAPHRPRVLLMAVAPVALAGAGALAAASALD